MKFEYGLGNDYNNERLTSKRFEGIHEQSGYKICIGISASGRSRFEAYRPGPGGSGFAYPIDPSSVRRCVEVDLGTYFPRVWRPSYESVEKGPGSWSHRHSGGNPDLVKQSLVVLEMRYQELTHIFRTVEPVAANLKVYGHRIRDLLNACCMEFEAACRGVLSANKYSPKTKKGDPIDRKHWSTNDYVKLRDPLILRTYEVSLVDFPKLGKIKPFEKWDENDPTKSMEWYCAYNAVKHDREKNFTQGQLKHCISAFCAQSAMIQAQFGPYPPVLPDYLQVNFLPETIDPSDYYLPDFKLIGKGSERRLEPSEKWKRRDFQF
jgi:hypothetical protein